MAQPTFIELDDTKEATVYLTLVAADDGPPSKKLSGGRCHKKEMVEHKLTVEPILFPPLRLEQAAKMSIGRVAAPPGHV